MFLLKSLPFVQSSSICRRPDNHTCFLLFISFVYLEMPLLRVFFVSMIAALSLYEEYVVSSFLPNNGVFLLCDHGLDFRHQLIM